MDKTCFETKSTGNVQKQVNKGFDMLVLVKFLKRHLLRFLHFTVIMLNIRTQSFLENIRNTIFFFVSYTLSFRYRGIFRTQ